MSKNRWDAGKWHNCLSLGETLHRIKPTQFICIFIRIISMQIRIELVVQKHCPTLGLIKNHQCYRHAMLTSSNIAHFHRVNGASEHWSNHFECIHLVISLKTFSKLCVQNEYSPWMKRAFVLECISGKPPLRLHALCALFYC